MYMLRVYNECICAYYQRMYTYVYLLVYMYVYNTELT